MELKAEFGSGVVGSKRSMAMWFESGFGNGVESGF